MNTSTSSGGYPLIIRHQRLPRSYCRLFEAVRDRNKWRATTASAPIHRVRKPCRVSADHGGRNQREQPQNHQDHAWEVSGPEAQKVNRINTAGVLAKDRPPVRRISANMWSNGSEDPCPTRRSVLVCQLELSGGRCHIVRVRKCRCRNVSAADSFVICRVGRCQSPA